MSKLGNCVAKWPVGLQTSYHTEPGGKKNIKLNIDATF